MHPRSKNQVSQRTQRNVIAWNIDTLKSVALFEIAQAIPAFVSVTEFGVNKIQDPSYLARSHSLRDQCICWSLLAMGDHRNNMHKPRLRARFVNCHLRKTDKGFIEERAEEEAAVEERPRVFTYSLTAHSVMGKSLALANRILIINSPDSFDELIIQGNFSNLNPFLLGLFALFRPLKPKTRFHQLSKVRTGRAAKLSHSKGYLYFGAVSGTALHEGKEIDSLSAVAARPDIMVSGLSRKR